MSDLSPEMQMQCHRVSQQAVDLTTKLTLEMFSELGAVWEKVKGEWTKTIPETSDGEGNGKS